MYFFEFDPRAAWAMTWSETLDYLDDARRIKRARERQGAKQ